MSLLLLSLQNGAFHLGLSGIWLAGVFVMKFIIGCILLIFCQILYAAGEGRPLREGDYRPNAFYRIVFDLEFSRHDGLLKPNEPDPIGRFGGFLPMVDPSEWEAVSKYFQSFYFTNSFIRLEIDAESLGEIRWRKHPNLQNGEFFGKIKKESVIDVTYWQWDTQQGKFIQQDNSTCEDLLTN